MDFLSTVLAHPDTLFPMDIREQILQDPKQRLLSAVKKLPHGTIFIGESSFTSGPGPRELLDAIQVVPNPLALLTQAAIIVAFREKNGKTGYRATN